MKCNSDYHADICPARRRNGDCTSEYPCRHKVELHKPKTNSDNVRCMNDEELATLYNEFCDTVSSYCCSDKYYGNCKACFLDWLKQPYKEDAND